MKKTSLFITALFIITLPQCGDDGDKKTATKFYAGYSESIITPPDGTPLGGYGMPGGSRVSTGVHDELLTQALFIGNDAGENFVIITLDTAGMMFEFAEWGPGIREIRENISRETKSADISPENILVACSHSHAAPDLIGFWQKLGEGPSVSYLEEILAAVTSAASEAAFNAVEADVFMGSTLLEGYTGRDKGCSDILDNEVSIIQARKKDSTPIATVANWAAHPTTMGGDNTLISADFIWGYREEILAGTGAPGMYLQGFIAAVHGGELPIEGSGWDRTYNKGKLLSDAVIAVLSGLAVSEDYSISHKEAIVSSEVKGSLALLGDSLGNLKRTRDIPGSRVVTTLPVTWHRLGNSEFVTLPGEGTPEYSLIYKGKMRADFNFAVGLGNDEVGYIIDPESIEKDDSGQLAGYELLMGFGADIGPDLYEAHEKMGWFSK